MSGGKSAQNDIIKFQNEQVEKQYDMDLKNFQFTTGKKYDEEQEKFVQQYDKDGTKKGTIHDTYEYAKEQLELQKQADKKTIKYQEETAKQNWEQGLAFQQYEWDQQKAVYEKNQEQYLSQLEFNDLAFENALVQEQMVLDEAFIQSAFQNQGLVQDLYEATGAKGFEEAAIKLNLQSQEANSEYGTNKELLNLSQATTGATYDTANVQLGILGAGSQADFQQANTIHDLATAEALKKFQKANLLVDTKTQEQVTDFRNEMIRRQQTNNQRDAANKSVENEIKALQAAGQAQLSQAGRSQGKAVQAVLAELGRQQNYIADTIVRGKNTADAQIKQNQVQSLKATQKAALAEQQIDYSSVQGITKAIMQVDQINNNLSISNAEKQINLNKIQQGVADNLSMTELEVKKLEQDLELGQVKSGLSLKEMDFDLENLGTQFAMDQDILEASLESAVSAFEQNKEDILQDKTQADMLAEAMKMTDPSVGQEAISLENFKPIDIPDPVYMDPQKPNIPPAPIKGATQSLMTTGQVLPGAVMSGVTAGLGTIAGLSAAGVTGAASATGFAALGAAGPIGLAVGAGAMLMELF